MATEPWNIDSGELRQQIVIQTMTVGSANTRGTPAQTWQSLGPPVVGTAVRCKITTPSGRKLEISRQYAPTAQRLVIMRYRPTMDPEKVANLAKNTRLVYKGNIWNISWIDDVEQRHVRLEIYCTELQ